MSPAERLQKININVQTHFYRHMSMLITSFGGEAAKTLPGMRGALPEPFDVMNHMGNLAVSLLSGSSAALWATVVYAKCVNKTPEGGSVRRAKSIAAAAGLGAGIVLNGLVETRTGQRLISWPNTLDPLDFIYGIGGAIIGSTVVPHIYASPSDASDVPQPTETLTPSFHVSE